MGKPMRQNANKKTWKFFLCTSHSNGIANMYNEFSNETTAEEMAITIAQALANSTGDSIWIAPPMAQPIFISPE